MLLSGMKADKPKQEYIDQPKQSMQKKVGRLPTGRCSPDEHHAAAAAGTIQAAGNFVQAYRNTPKQYSAAPLIKELGAWLQMFPKPAFPAVKKSLPFFQSCSFCQAKGGL